MNYPRQKDLKMIEIDLKQGSPEWHIFRSSIIGASDSAPILGISPYKTRAALWDEKMGLSSGQFKTKAMQRGNDLEPMIREKISGYLDCQLVTKVFVSEEHPWMACSVDGIDLEKGIVVEIKTANEKDHRLAQRFAVPEKYYSQLQHILEVCGLDVIWYCSYNENYPLAYFPVQRDKTFIDKMIIEEKIFWDSLNLFQKPEETKTHNERNDEDWKLLASQWKEIQDMKKEIMNREESLKSALISMSGEENAQGSGLKLTKRTRKGSIDYSTIIELEEVDLENYRNPPITYWMIENE